MLKENNVRTGFVEREAFENVCRHLPAPLAAVMRFAYVTGWRIDREVLPLEWRQVDVTERLRPTQELAGTVRLDAGTTKNDEGRVFPFTRGLASRPRGAAGGSGPSTAEWDALPVRVPSPRQTDHALQ
jgi:integrase